MLHQTSVPLIILCNVDPRELQLNKANTSDKETSFLDLNIKVIGNNIHANVYNKRDDFGIPIVNFPWLSDDVPRLPSHGIIYILQLVRFARCCTSVFDFHSKNLQVKSRKYRGIFEEHSPVKLTTSSENDWSQQVEHMQVPKGRDQVSGGVSVPCRHATPIANALWKPLKIR